MDDFKEYYVRPAPVNIENNYPGVIVKHDSSDEVDSVDEICEKIDGYYNLPHNLQNDIVSAIKSGKMNLVELKPGEVVDLYLPIWASSAMVIRCSCKLNKNNQPEITVKNAGVVFFRVNGAVKGKDEKSLDKICMNMIEKAQPLINKGVVVFETYNNKVKCDPMVYNDDIYFDDDENNKSGEPII